MRSDVTELRAFYDGPLGRAAGLVLAERVRRRWPALGAMQVLGLGYAPPLLDGLDGSARMYWRPCRRDRARCAGPRPGAAGRC